MSIQSFTEKLLADIEKNFEQAANDLLVSVRQKTGRELYIAGRMDQISDDVKQIHETYKLFIKSDEEKEEDDSKSLY